MYSGTTFRVKSGRLMGVHQRIDRVAKRVLTSKLPSSRFFPTVHTILHFEGHNGPDGIKRKSPAQDEPWHYVDPHDPHDMTLREMINDHVYNLTEALRYRDQHRAGFEAAWLAHAITDGLTPAHHYPLEEKLEELRDGKGLETRTSAKEKLLLPGKNRRQMIRNNWEFWGAKGVMTTHVAFELGIATSISGRGLPDIHPTDETYEHVLRDGVIAIFDEALAHIAELNLYEEFYKSGWTRPLARDVKNTLLPEIIQVVSLAWYYASEMAECEHANR